MMTILAAEVPPQNQPRTLNTPANNPAARRQCPLAQHPFPVGGLLHVEFEHTPLAAIPNAPGNTSAGTRCLPALRAPFFQGGRQARPPSRATHLCSRAGRATLMTTQSPSCLTLTSAAMASVKVGPSVKVNSYSRGAFVSETAKSRAVTLSTMETMAPLQCGAKPVRVAPVPASLWRPIMGS